MLPEIVGKWYTRKPVADANGVVAEMTMHMTDPQRRDDEDHDKCWCYCNLPSFGKMIGCDNESCTIECSDMTPQSAQLQPAPAQQADLTP